MSDSHVHVLSHFGAAEIAECPGAVVLILDGRDGSRHRYTTDLGTLEAIADALAKEVQRLRGQEVPS